MEHMGSEILKRKSQTLKEIKNKSFFRRFHGYTEVSVPLRRSDSRACEELMHVASIYP
jgi:hypothetical protein